MTIGPIQAFVIGFPDNEHFEGRIAEELARLSDIGQIRIIDAVFVLREEDEVAVLSVSDLDDEQRAELRTVVGALVGLGLAGGEGAIAGAELGDAIDADAPTAAERLAVGLLEDLPDGSSALVLAIEHLWAVPLRARFATREGSCSLIAASRRKTCWCWAWRSATSWSSTVDRECPTGDSYSLGDGGSTRIAVRFGRVLIADEGVNDD